MTGSIAWQGAKSLPLGSHTITVIARDKLQGNTATTNVVVVHTTARRAPAATPATLVRSSAPARASAGSCRAARSSRRELPCRRGEVATLAALKLREVMRRYGERTVLGGREQSTARSGTTLAVVGPNGAGKTTLLRMLATLLRPSRR